MSCSPGVTYLPTVNTRPDPSLNSYTLWIRPLPYVRDPATVARQLSRSAPVRISDALALRPLTRTVSGSVTDAADALGMLLRRVDASPPPFLFAVAATSVSPLTPPATTRPSVYATAVAGGRNRRAISTPACTSPPGLSRRSSTNDVAPRARSVSTALATLGSASALNSFRRMYPTLPPSMRNATGFAALEFRRRVTTRVSYSAPVSPERTPTATSASALAWIRETAWNADLFLVSTPSTETSSSPCLTPARAAGESSTKPSTRSRVGSEASSAMFRPTPLMSYFSRGANAAGSTNRENGSPRLRRMSRMTSYASARVTGGCFV